MPRKAKISGNYVRTKWQYWAFWFFFFLWIALVAVGNVVPLNFQIRTSHILPLVENSGNMTTDAYIGGTYTDKFTFIWITNVIVLPMRFALTLVAAAYLTSRKEKNMTLTLFGIFFIVYIGSEGSNIISGGLEWKDANKIPSNMSDTNHEKNLANSYYYCCEYGNLTAYCENYRPNNASLPCYGWVSGTKLDPNPDFLTIYALSLGCFVCAAIMAVLGYSGREELLTPIKTASGETILVGVDRL